MYVILFLCLLLFIILWRTCSLNLWLFHQVGSLIVIFCCIFFFGRYFSGMQWIIHTPSDIVSLSHLFIVGVRTKLDLMLLCFYLHLNKFLLLLAPPVPVVHEVFQPGCLTCYYSCLSHPCGLACFCHSCMFWYCV